jgi:excisionase family DNA binding protein
MNFELGLDESADEGIKRIILERVDEIYDLMVNPHPTREKAVHEARKSFKRIRAALRLVRDETGAQWYRRENAFYRDASRLLAPVRDSTVLVLALDSVAEAYADIVPPRAFAAIRRKLEERHEAIVRELLDEQDVMATVAGLMQEGRQRIVDMPISEADFSLFDDGLGRVYRRGRLAMAEALADPGDPDKFHEWRKQVKYLWHHLEILQPTWPLMLLDTASELHIASDFLGDAHDLVELKETLLTEKELFENEPNLVTLLALLDRRRASLEGASWTLGQRLYHEDPQAFVERISTYWDAWQNDVPAMREALQRSVETKADLAAAASDGFQLLSTSEAAKLMGISTKKLRAAIKDGRLQAWKIGRFWVIRRDKLPADQRKEL